MMSDKPFRPAGFRLGDTPVVLDPLGALWVPGASLLVVSDLHFEKGSFFAARGQMIPPYDTRATLEIVELLLERYRPERVLSLGDSFHDPVAEDRMMEVDASRLEAICRSTEWVWLLGNHDPTAPRRFSGDACKTAKLGGLSFVHEPGEVLGWQVAGHLHPAATARKDGRRVRRRCFITDGNRLVLPAIGAFTGGLNVLDDAFADVFPGPIAVFMMGDNAVYRVPTTSLCEDGQGPVRSLSSGQAYSRRNN